MKLSLLTASLMLCGCSTMYRNNSMSQAEAEAAFPQANAQCTGASYGVPMPPINYTPQQTGGTTFGTFNATQSSGLNTSNWNGDYQSSTYVAPDYGASLANGYQLGQAIRARRDRATVYDGCMAGLGWIKQPWGTTR